MLKGLLYNIAPVTHQDGQINARLELEVGHAIFKGHFPGQPVLPGACMLQMVKEVLEEVLDTPLQLTKAASMKFIQPVDPQKNNSIELVLKYTFSEYSLSVTAQMMVSEVVCFKFQGEFVRL